MRRTRTFWSHPAYAILLGGVAAAALLALRPTAHALETGQRGFSPEEQQRLAAGKLVVRRQTEIRGDAHFIGGMSWQVVDVDAETVWRTASEITQYPKFLPAVVEARRLNMVEGAERVFIRHEYSVIDASYCVLVSKDPQQRALKFRLDHTQPSAIDEAFGEMRITALGPSKSVISFSIFVDVGDGIIARLLRSQVHEWTLRVPDQLRKYLAKQQKKRDAATAGSK